MMNQMDLQDLISIMHVHISNVRSTNRKKQLGIIFQDTQISGNFGVIVPNSNITSKKKVKKFFCNMIRSTGFSKYNIWLDKIKRQYFNSNTSNIDYNTAVILPTETDATSINGSATEYSSQYYARNDQLKNNKLMLI